MQPVVRKLIEQFRLNQLKFNRLRPTMADQTESEQQMTSANLDVFHDPDQETLHEMAMLVRVTQLGGKSLPICNFTERQIASKYRQITGIDPVALTLMGPQDVLLEFSSKSDVVGSSLKMHGPQMWDGINVNVNCLVAPKPGLIEMFYERERAHKEKEELLREREVLKREKSEYEQRLGEAVQDMGRKLEQLDRRIESEVPLIPSGIITPNLHETGGPTGETQEVVMSAPNTQLVMTPGLPLFSGAEPTPRDEATYEQWKFQVRGMRSSCPEGTVRTALIASVRGGASEAVSFVGFKASVNDILAGMEKRFGKKATGDKLQSEFYQLQQEKGERIQQFAGRLEKAFKKLRDAFPDRYQEAQLKERLFHGVTQHVRDSMRYLYDKESTTYDVLLAAMKGAELEWVESRSQARLKSVTTSEKTEIEELREKLDELQATVKSATVTKKERDKKKTPKNSPRKEDVRKQSKGPAVTSAGPFKPDQKPMQCHKCQGWGHGWRECATKGNVDWGRVHGEPTPNVQPGPAENQQ